MIYLDFVLCNKKENTRLGFILLKGDIYLFQVILMLMNMVLRTIIEMGEFVLQGEGFIAFDHTYVTYV